MEEPKPVPIDARPSRDSERRLESIDDEATLFASPLPITGERKTTKRKEIWVRPIQRGSADCSRGISTML